MLSLFKPGTHLCKYTNKSGFIYTLAENSEKILNFTKAKPML
jgi:hypothetical protein